MSQLPIFGATPGPGLAGPAALDRRPPERRRWAPRWYIRTCANMPGPQAVAIRSGRTSAQHSRLARPVESVCSSDGESVPSPLDHPASQATGSTLGSLRNLVEDIGKTAVICPARYYGPGHRQIETCPPLCGRRQDD